MFSAMETPRLVLDKAKLAKNAKQFFDLAAKNKVLLRPHLKTSKSTDVAKIATGGRMPGVTVSTLKEAEHFASERFSRPCHLVGPPAQT